ncbi:MAG TPA: hypothetical protein VH912_08870 [Streptosporangiaceae bacterium]
MSQSEKSSPVISCSSAMSSAKYGINCSRSAHVGGWRGRRSRCSTARNGRRVAVRTDAGTYRPSLAPPRSTPRSARVAGESATWVVTFSRGIVSRTPVRTPRKSQIRSRVATGSARSCR